MPAAAAIDAVVVLGAVTAAPGVPGPALQRRLEHGVRLWSAGRAGFLILTGGVVGPPPSEAEVMRDLALAAGVPSERIIIEPLARNTFENAVYTGRILRDRGWRRVLLVTDTFHLPRAIYVFRRLGLAAEPAGVPRPADVSRPAWSWWQLRELAGLAHSAVLFRLGAHKPLLAAVWGDQHGVR